MTTQVNTKKTEKMVKVTVFNSTKKAILVRDEQGREGWVRIKKYMAGQVPAKDFEKGVAFLKNLKKEREEQKKLQEKRQALSNSFVKGNFKIEKETEKAIAIVAKVHDHVKNRFDQHIIWLPKSQVTKNGIKGWILKNKLADIGENTIFRSMLSLVTENLQ